MLEVFRNSWALFLGMFLLMIGNGLQGTLLGLRGDIEGFSTFQMSVIMAAYFAGFLFSSRLVPKLIRSVGHVRVFAALGSMISAVLILYPALTDPIAWTVGRLVFGFCICGVYITAESWLNDASTNEMRGKSLSVYMIVQMAGIVVAQYIILLGDVSGFILFIIPSVLVSISFAPILLSVGKAPQFELTKPLPIRQLIDASPLACTGMFLLGGVFSAQFGMLAVYGAQAGLSVAQVSLLVSVTYISALVLQYPIGWVSDRMDRRVLIIIAAAVGGLGAMLAFLLPGLYAVMLVSAVIVGGMSNPLYALLIAYANDHLAREDMAAASGGFLFINGVGAIAGPILVGLIMDGFGVHAYWLFVGLLMLAIAVYGLWRMTRRQSTTPVDELVSYAPVMAQASPVMVETAQEVYIEAEEEAIDERAAEAEESALAEAESEALGSPPPAGSTVPV